MAALVRWLIVLAVVGFAWTHAHWFVAALLTYMLVMAEIDTLLGH